MIDGEDKITEIILSAKRLVCRITAVIYLP